MKFDLYMSNKVDYYSFEGSTRKKVLVELSTHSIPLSSLDILTYASSNIHQKHVQCLIDNFAHFNTLLLFVIHTYIFKCHQFNYAYYFIVKIIQMLELI